MIVCICANVSDKQIEQALKDGKDPVQDLGCCQNCCICKEHLLELQVNKDSGD